MAPLKRQDLQLENDVVGEQSGDTGVLSGNLPERRNVETRQVGCAVTLRFPRQEIRDQPKPRALAFLGVEYICYNPLDAPCVLRSSDSIWSSLIPICLHQSPKFCARLFGPENSENRCVCYQHTKNSIV